MAIITLTPTSPTPLYDQICKQVKEAVLRGELEAGQALPSIRQLALELGTSVITVKRAYQELEREGWIITRQGRGCFVASVEGQLLEENRLEAVARHLRLALAEAEKIGVPKEEVEKLFRQMIGGDF